MKTFGRYILFTAALAIAASTILAAPANAAWSDQWHRTKFGRSSPQEEARQRAEQANIANRDEVREAPSAEAWSDYLVDQRYLAKYGRPSPNDEQRLKDERANTAFREEIIPAAEPNANTFFEQWFKTKFGRHSPRHESREKANGR